MKRNVFCAFWLFFASPVMGYEAGKFYYQGNTKEKVIALTFDDGPGPYTPKILEYLKEHKIRATFFMEGSQVTVYPVLAKQVLEAGHELGNHTYNHINFNTAKTADRATFIKEVEMTEDAIEKATGTRTRVLRMPHGAFGKHNRAWLLPTLKEKGFALVHWTFGTDWHLKKPAVQMAEEYIKNAGPGAVFLLHDGGRNRDKTFEALKIFVPALEQKGYQFVAAEDLFNK